MFVFTLKSTGETIVLPTPSGNEQVSIDTLPGGEPLTEDQVKEYLEFKERFKLVNQHWKFVKDKKLMDGRKYSEKYSREEHHKFFNDMLKSNFKNAKEMIIHVITTDTPWNPV